MSNEDLFLATVVVVFEVELRRHPGNAGSLWRIPLNLTSTGYKCRETHVACMHDSHDQQPML